MMTVMVVFAVVRLFGYNSKIVMMSGAGVFQVGEFSFIVAQAGLATVFTEQERLIC